MTLDEQDRLVLRVGLEGGRFILPTDSPAAMIRVRSAVPVASYRNGAWCIPATYPGTWWLSQLGKRDDVVLQWTGDAATKAECLGEEGEQWRLDGARARLERAFPFAQLGLPRPLYAHQEAGVDFLVRALSERRGVMCLASIGSGKTAVALATTEILDAYPAVAVVPGGIRPQWEAAVRDWLPHRSVVSMGGGRKPKRANVTVVSLQAVHRLADRIAAFHPKMILIDECHRLRNRNRQSVATLALLEQCPRACILGLTATPHVNGPLDLLNQVEAIGALGPLFGSDRSAARARFRVLVEADGGMRALGVLLASGGYAWAPNAAQVQANLPPLRRDVVDLDLAGSTSGYKAATERVKEWLRGAGKVFEGEWTPSFRAQVRGNVDLLREAAGLAKVSVVAEQVTDWMVSEDGVVLFVHHHSVGDALATEVRKTLASGGSPDALGRPCNVAVLDGRTGPEERRATVERLRAAREPCVVVVGLQAGGEGLDGLQHLARLVGFVELPWHPTGLEQAIGRCRRVGASANTPVIATIWKAKGTVDQRCWAIIERKAAESADMRVGLEVGDEVLRKVLQDLQKET